MHLNSSTTELIGLLLRLVRWKAGISQDRIAELISASQPMVSRWERGAMQPPEAMVACWFQACLKAANLQDQADIKLASETAGRLLSAQPGAGQAGEVKQGWLTIRQLAGGAASLNQALLPYYADIAAGNGECQEALSGPRSYIEVPGALLEQDPGCYALRVVGDSMQPLLQPGDLVVVSPAAQPIDGAIVAAYLEPDGDVIKRYRVLPGGELRLEPLNPDYPTITLQPDGEQTVRIWGRVIFQQREL